MHFHSLPIKIEFSVNTLSQYHKPFSSTLCQYDFCIVIDCDPITFQDKLTKSRGRGSEQVFSFLHFTCHNPTTRHRRVKLLPMISLRLAPNSDWIFVINIEVIILQVTSGWSTVRTIAFQLECIQSTLISTNTIWQRERISQLLQNSYWTDKSSTFRQKPLRKTSLHRYIHCKKEHRSTKISPHNLKRIDLETSRYLTFFKMRWKKCIASQFTCYFNLAECREDL